MAMIWENAQSGKPTVPFPQAEDEDVPGTFTKIKGKNGAANMRVIGANNNKLNVNVDGSVPITDNNASITIDSPQLPSVLGVNGALIIEGIAEGTPIPVSGAVTVSSLPNVTLNALPVGNSVVGGIRIHDGSNDSNKLTVNSNGSVSIASSSVPTTHHNAVVAPADGADAAVTGYKIIAIQINGTSSSRTVLFSGSVDGISFYPVMGVNMATWDSAINTTGTGELWQFDVGGLNYFRARVDAVSGGNVTVKSNVVV